MSTSRLIVQGLASLNKQQPFVGLSNCSEDERVFGLDSLEMATAVLILRLGLRGSTDIENCQTVLVCCLHS